MRNLSRSLLNQERTWAVVAGRSHIALVIPQTATVTEEQSTFAVQQLQITSEDLPDLRWIYWTAGTASRFEQFVTEPARDLFSLTIDLQGIGSDSIQSVAFPVIHRIQQEPRRIINHRCVMGLFLLAAV